MQNDLFSRLGMMKEKSMAIITAVAGQIDCDLFDQDSLLVPDFFLTAGLAQNPSADFIITAGSFGQQDEVLRRNQAPDNTGRIKYGPASALDMPVSIVTGPDAILLFRLTSADGFLPVSDEACLGSGGLVLSDIKSF